MINQPPGRSAADLATVQGYRPIEELIPPHWQAGSLVANGTRQHYYRTGGGKPPLLLLHGFLDGALGWLRSARLLERDYDVIMADARGHGRSARAAGGFEQADLTEDVAALIRALGLGAPRVIGHSQGGTTGIHLAAAHPELVGALVVEGWGDDAQPGADPSSSPGYRAWLDAFAAWLGQLQHQSHAERMRSALGQLPPGAPLLPEDEYVPWVDSCAHLDPELLQIGMGMWARLAETGRAMREALGRVGCPTLIMKSGFFPQPGAPAVREEASDRPNIRIVRFEHTGHLIHREQLELFVAEARRFLV